MGVVTRLPARGLFPGLERFPPLREGGILNILIALLLNPFPDQLCLCRLRLAVPPALPAAHRRVTNDPEMELRRLAASLRQRHDSQ